MDEKIFNIWLESIEKEEASVYAKVLTTEVNAKQRAMVIKEDGTFIGSIHNEAIDEQVVTLSKEKLSEKNPSSSTEVFYLDDGTELQVFIDVYKPQPNVVIFGAGHDAIPVVDFISKVGFKTTLVDQRPGYNTKERFPKAERIVARSNDYAEKVTINKNTYVIIMNHHMERDEEALAFALDSPAPYIGVLGPKSRRERIIRAIEERGRSVSDKDKERIYNPIGLDIGARTPKEIAISITAELIAFKNGYPGGFLKDSKYIHRESALREKIT